MLARIFTGSNLGRSVRRRASYSPTALQQCASPAAEETAIDCRGGDERQVIMNAQLYLAIIMCIMIAAVSTGNGSYKTIYTRPCPTLSEYLLLSPI